MQLTGEGCDEAERPEHAESTAEPVVLEGGRLEVRVRGGDASPGPVVLVRGDMPQGVLLSCRIRLIVTVIATDAQVIEGVDGSLTWSGGWSAGTWSPGHEPADDPRVEAISLAARELVAMRDRWLKAEGLSDAERKKRTLTNLYNQRPTWLDLAHKKLDSAVMVAYGWPTDLTDEQILERLLALNLERAKTKQDQIFTAEPKTGTR